MGACCKYVSSLLIGCTFPTHFVSIIPEIDANFVSFYGRGSSDTPVGKDGV